MQAQGETIAGTDGRDIEVDAVGPDGVMLDCCTGIQRNKSMTVSDGRQSLKPSTLREVPQAGLW